MRVFALTGGVASGKSTVARRFRRSIPVIDADELARQAVEPGQPALQELTQRFGERVLSADGALNREGLASIIFDDEPARLAVNRIIHPRVGALLVQRLKELEAAGASVACYEVPLLFETGMQDRFRPVVLVAASPQVQVERAMARNGWSREQAQARVAAQLPLSEKAQAADYVIDNNGSLEQTLSAADAVLRQVLAELKCEIPNQPS